MQETQPRRQSEGSTLRNTGNIGQIFGGFSTEEMRDFVGQYAPGIRTARGTYADKVLSNLEMVGPIDAQQLFKAVGYQPGRGQPVVYVVEQGGNRVAIEYGGTKVAIVEKSENGGELKWLGKEKGTGVPKWQTETFEQDMTLVLSPSLQTGLISGQDGAIKENTSETAYGEARSTQMTPLKLLIAHDEDRQNVMSTPFQTPKQSPPVVINIESSNKGLAFNLNNLKADSGIPVFAQTNYDLPKFGPVDITIPLI